jgi:hypothetical protein
MKLNKIPLQPLLEILKNLYDEGVDFIDLSGGPSVVDGEKQDVVKISVKPEYMTDVNYEQEVELIYSEEEEEEEKESSSEPLDDDDIDDLI